MINGVKVGLKIGSIKEVCVLVFKFVSVFVIILY